MHRKKTSTALGNAWQTTLGVCWKRRRQSRGAEHDIGPGYLFSIPKPVASTWSLNYIVFHPSWRLIDPGYDKIVVDCCLEMVIQQPRALPCCVNRVNGPVSVRLASSDILWYVLMLFIRNCSANSGDLASNSAVSYGHSTQILMAKSSNLMPSIP